MIYVGTAGWSVPKASLLKFPTADSWLESYAARLPAVEINSSFYRHHQEKTYVRWAASVPSTFRFSVKLAREFTHQAKLDLDREAQSSLGTVMRGYRALGDNLGCLLIQLPPKLAFDLKIADAFLASVRGHYAGAVALEPRHPSWVGEEAQDLLARHLVGRVWADPAPIANPEDDAGKAGCVRYFRLHGWPDIYKSDYESSRLAEIARMIATRKRGGTTWCIFDNTTFGFATENALTLKQLCRGVNGLG